MDTVCYAFENADGELEAPFKEYLKKYDPPQNETPKANDKRIKRVINVREHIRHLSHVKGGYNHPPLVKAYKCRKTGEISEIGILRIKEGRILIRIGFVKFETEEKIILFDAFDKPYLYEKKKKRDVEKTEKEFVKTVEKYIRDYLKNGYSLPL